MSFEEIVGEKSTTWSQNLVVKTGVTKAAHVATSLLVSPFNLF